MTQAVGGSSVRGSSTAVDQSKVFDIGTEAGLLFLLRSIHRSGLKQVVKNQLRDTLFDFKSGDARQFEFVKKVLGDAGFTVTMAGATASTSAPAAEAPRTGRVGFTRTVPKFGMVTVKNVKAETLKPAMSAAPAAEPVATLKEPVPAVAPTPEPVPTPDPTPVAALVPTPPLPEAEPAAAPTAIPQASPIPTAPIAPSVSPEGTNALARIQEIKRSINEKVGNPVTLIDINNQVGREYMNALLSAMKVINGGRPDDLAAAMSRLETAYAAALELTKDASPRVAAPSTSAAAPAPAFEPPKAVAEPMSQVTSSVPPSAPVPPPTPASATVTPLSAVRPAEPAAPLASEVPDTVRTAGNPVKINISAASADAMERASQGFGTTSATPAASIPMPESEVAASVPIMSKLSSAQSAIKSDVIAMEPTAEMPAAPMMNVTPEGDGPARLISVAKEEQLQNLMRQNQIKEAQRNQTAESIDRATMDPFMLPEVTAGLKQLLSEWSLFKGSGFFGTGPSGLDHPLYKQIAGLTMAAVIAGRFEGATPSVKQSITDYMNGWRYEEGIVHEHTETFEHYLRRVIKHILDQKGIRPR